MEKNIWKKAEYPVKLSEGLWVLGNYYFNIILIKGETASALVEVGVSGVADTVIAQLESLGVYPDYLVVTHPHTDHVSGLDAYRERYPEAATVAGEGADKFLSHPRALEMMIKEDAHISKMLGKFGHKPGRPPIVTKPDLGDPIFVKGGHELDLGGVMLRLLSVKGHSPGSIAAHIPGMSALIISDSMGFHFPGRLFLPLFFTGYKDYLNSFKALRALGPKILCPGHQGPILGDDVEKAFNESHRSLISMLERIKGDSRDDEEIAEELFKESYVDEFTIYTPENIKNCSRLLVRRAREANV